MRKTICLALAFVFVAVLGTVARGQDAAIPVDQEKARQKKAVEQGVRDRRQQDRDAQQKSDMETIMKDNEEMHKRWQKQSGY